MDRSRRVAVAALTFFAVTTMVGIVIATVASIDPAGLGWSDATGPQDFVIFPPGVMLVTAPVVAGVCVAVVGLVGCCGILGYLIGSGSKPVRGHAASDSL